MFKSAAQSHIGCVRSCNEDSYIENPELGLWLVADGVGGSVHGDFASQVVAQTVERKIRLGVTLKQAIEDAHAIILKLGKNKPEVRGMASTVVALHCKGTHYDICWVGDSRAYLINQDNQISQLTVDHNQAQHLVEAGEITLEEAHQHPTQRFLMHAVGGHEEGWRVDSIQGELSIGDKLLLCSDGLSGELDDAEIVNVFEDQQPLSVITAELLERALTKGGSDNITLTLMTTDREGQTLISQSKAEELIDDVNKPTTHRPNMALTYAMLGSAAALVVVLISVWVAS